jgi:hypothetical protein
MAGKPFEAAWSLIEALEPNHEAATHLSRLLRDLPADTYKTEGLLEALETWHAPEDALAAEEDSNA